MDTRCFIRVETASTAREQEFFAISLPDCKINMIQLLEEIRNEEKMKRVMK
jgi:hypothetical protein